MSGERGIKEVLELLDGAKVLLVVGKEVAADGKFTVSDLIRLSAHMTELSSLVEAFRGLNDVPAELKDLKADEARELLEKVFEIVSVFRGA